MQNHNTAAVVSELEINNLDKLSQLPDNKVINEMQNQKLNIFGKIVYSKIVQGFVTICILLNSIQLGLETTSWWNSMMGKISTTVDPTLPLEKGMQLIVIANTLKLQKLK